MATPDKGRKKPGVTPGHPTDIKIGICYGLGLSREDTAAMAGCSIDTVDLRKLEPVAKEWREWASGLMATPSMDGKKFLMVQSQRRAHKALAAYDEALESDDIETKIKGADRILDRGYGKATQTVETTSEITERHVFELPAPMLETLRSVAEALQPRRIEGEVIDVTPTDDERETE